MKLPPHSVSSVCSCPFLFPSGSRMANTVLYASFRTGFSLLPFLLPLAGRHPLDCTWPAGPWQILGPGVKQLEKHSEARVGVISFSIDAMQRWRGFKCLLKSFLHWVEIWGVSRPATAFILGSIVVAFSFFHLYPRNWFRNHRNWIWSCWMLADSWLHSSQEILPAGWLGGGIQHAWSLLAAGAESSHSNPVTSHSTRTEVFCFIL